MIQTCDGCDNGRRCAERGACQADPVAATWAEAYPDRRAWAEIGEEAQAEWRRVFALYDAAKARTQREPWGALGEVVFAVVVLGVMLLVLWWVDPTGALLRMPH